MMKGSEDDNLTIETMGYKRGRAQIVPNFCSWKLFPIKLLVYYPEPYGESRLSELKHG